MSAVVDLDIERASTVASNLDRAASGLGEFDVVLVRVGTDLDVTGSVDLARGPLGEAGDTLAAVATVLRTRCELAASADRLVTLRHHEHLEERFADAADIVLDAASGGVVSSMIDAAVGDLVADLATGIVWAASGAGDAGTPTDEAHGGPDPHLAWATSEAWGVSPRFLTEVVAPLASGHLPTWKPKWIEETRDWQPRELELMTWAFTEWHDTHELTPHPDTWHLFTNYRDTPDDIPEHMAGGEFFPFVSDTFGLDLALAVWPSNARASGTFSAVAKTRSPLALTPEQLFMSKLVGVRSPLVGHKYLGGREGFLNRRGSFVKFGWSGSEMNGGGYHLRLGVGRKPGKPNQARYHPVEMESSFVPNEIGNRLAREIREELAKK